MGRYPLDSNSLIAEYEQMQGGATPPNVRELFKLYVEEVNHAYQTGLNEGAAAILCESSAPVC